MHQSNSVFLSRYRVSTRQPGDLLGGRKRHIDRLLMIAGFGSAYFGFRHEPGAAILFTLSLGLFTFSLISFAREVKVAMSQNEFG